MDLTSYAIHAARFDCYPIGNVSTHRTCLQLGVVAEAGEIVGVLDKHVRKCGADSPWTAHECQTCRPRILDEAGDVLWFVVRLAVKTGDPVEFDEEIRPYFDPFTALVLLANDVMQNAHYAEQTASHTIYALLSCVSSICRRCDTTIEQVADLNIAKLEARRNDRDPRPIERSEMRTGAYPPGGSSEIRTRCHACGRYVRPEQVRPVSFEYQGAMVTMTPHCTGCLPESPP